MTPKERTAMQQALEALEYLPEMRGIEEAITALREALAEQVEQEPVAEVIVRPLRGDQSQPTTDIKWLQKPTTGKLYAAPIEPVKQEPIRFIWNGEGWIEADDYIWKTTDDHERRILYAAPQPVSQEPVGMTWHYAAIRLGEEFADNGPEGYYKFYPKQWLVWALETIPEAIQQPVRTKDLSDDEIADALYGKGCWRLGVHPDHLREYRRVIQADRELNK